MSPTRSVPFVDSPLHWEISDELFAKYRELIYREAGIALTDSKKSLLISRVAGRLRELGVASFAEYYNVVEDPAAADERGRLLDRICTNETQFFRDPRQFLYLNDEMFPQNIAPIVDEGWLARPATCPSSGKRIALPNEA